jgi:pimeloyl-ACP methyl ester carboxylesterase
VIALEATGQGRPIVLLHGVGANRAVWHLVIPELSRHRRVLAPDIPGFGQSPPAGPGFVLEAVADALAGALESRLKEPFDLLGNSLGGAVALVLARRHPRLVRRLVLSAPAGLSSPSRVLAAAARVASGPAVRLRAAAGAPLARVPAARRALLWGSIAAPERLSFEEARGLLEASRGSARIGAGVATALAADLRPELSALAVPVGFIWGEQDRIVPFATLRSVRELRPDAPIETLGGVAHVPQIEAPAEFVVSVRRLLERLGRRSPKR